MHMQVRIVLLDFLVSQSSAFIQISTSIENCNAYFHVKVTCIVNVLISTWNFLPILTSEVSREQFKLLQLLQLLQQRYDACIWQLSLSLLIEIRHISNLLSFCDLMRKFLRYRTIVDPLISGNMGLEECSKILKFLPRMLIYSRNLSWTILHTNPYHHYLYGYQR